MTCFRVVAIVMCLLVKYHSITRHLAVIIAISFLFLILTSVLDYYHYRFWWHYTPRVGTQNNYGRLSSKHTRFLPYQILGGYRTSGFGDRLCTKKVCENRNLEHILIFHLDDHQPQPRWSELKQMDPNATEYIGFHRTTAESAMKISCSDFKPSIHGRLMLGHGIYFARSIEHTKGKARFEGAMIAVKVNMGRVKEVTSNEIRFVSNTNSWHGLFDTVYYNHVDPKRDEFCISNNNQILEWIVVISKEFDDKPRYFNMDEDYDDTQCFCI